MNKKFLLPFFISFFLIGCATVPPVARIPFPENEYAALPQTGTGVVKGQAFLKTRGGDVKTAAGEQVWLSPETSYSKQWYEVNYLKSTPLIPDKSDERLQKYLTETQADAEGRFTFKNVPAGNYFLTTIITWEVPYGGELVKTGGVVSKKITVKDGEELFIILTRTR